MSRGRRCDVAPSARSDARLLERTGEHAEETIAGIPPARGASRRSLPAVGLYARPRSWPPTAWAGSRSNRPSGAKVAGDGTGQTIAIIDLYHDPNLQASLNAFDAQYNLPSVTLDVINQAGNQTDPGWAEEETLDVEWAHAIAPGANIAVVEVSPGTTDDQQFNNILAAIRTASQTTGVSVVSMSWGYDEFSGETSYDSSFTTAGVTFVAASGDNGTDRMAGDARPTSWPSAGPRSSWAPRAGTAPRPAGRWPAAGLSTIVTEPTYQNAVQSTGDRSTPDVAFDADPNTGVSIYVIPPDNTAGQGSWAVVGGTSVGGAGLGRDPGDRQPGPRPGRDRPPDRLHADRAGALRAAGERLQQGPGGDGR